MDSKPSSSSAGGCNRYEIDLISAAPLSESTLCTRPSQLDARIEVLIQKIAYLTQGEG